MKYFSALNVDFNSGTFDP